MPCNTWPAAAAWAVRLRPEGTISNSKIIMDLLHAYGHRMGFLTKLDFDNLLLDELPVNQLEADWGP